MDVDDYFCRDPAQYRRMGCRCAVDPAPPKVDFGCLCPSCGAQCRECSGYGFSDPPVKRVHQILSRVRSRIRRRVRTRGNPPGFVRLTQVEIRTLLRKREDEDADHWIKEYVEPGPPVRVMDVIVVVDRRK